MAKRSSAAHLVLMTAGILAIAYFCRSVLVPIALALVIATALRLPVNWLCRWHFPPFAAAAAVMIAVGLAGAFATVHLIRPAVVWARSMPDHWPQINQKLHNLTASFDGLGRTAAGSSPAVPDNNTPAPALIGAPSNQLVGTVFTWTWSTAAGAGETIILVFMFLASGDRLLEKLVGMFPKLQDKRKAVDISREVQQNLSSYLLTVTAVNVSLGAVVGLILWLLKMPNAAVWGGIAGCANFILYFGPIAGIIAVAVAGLLTFDTVGSGLLPAGAYLLCHLVEANVITPFVLGRRFTLSPIIIFIALIFFAWLWGVAGALLAVPVLVSLKVICLRVDSFRPTAEFLAR